MDAKKMVARVEIAEALVKELERHDERESAAWAKSPIFVYGVLVEGDEVYVQGRLAFPSYTDGSLRQFPETCRVRAHAALDLATAADYMAGRMRQLLVERGLTGRELVEQGAVGRVPAAGGSPAW